jgi:TonB family protein
MFALSLVLTIIMSAGSSAVLSLASQESLPSAPTPQRTADLNPDLDGIYHAGKDVTLPKLIYSVQPEFSEQARKRKIAANSTVKFIVQADGSVRNVKVIKSAAEHYTNSKDREAAVTLDPNAMEAVRQYRFQPATFQGKPVPCWVTLEVNFQPF